MEYRQIFNLQNSNAKKIPLGAGGGMIIISSSSSLLEKSIGHMGLNYIGYLIGKNVLVGFN